MTADEGEAVIQPAWPPLGPPIAYECLLPAGPKWCSRPRAGLQAAPKRPCEAVASRSRLIVIRRTFQAGAEQYL